MMKLKRHINSEGTGYLEFKCPHCDKPEIVYIMPRLFCHECRRSYNFDPEELESEVQDRVAYHFTKEEGTKYD